MGRASVSNHFPLRKGAIMNRKFSMLKSMAVTFALVAGVSGIARADDNSMTRFGGDGYAFFHENKPIVDKAPSTFRQTNPHGLSERQLEALSDESQVYQLQQPVFDKAPSTFHATNPHGLTFGDYEALSSESAFWQRQAQPATKAFAATDKPVVAKSAVTTASTTSSSN
jgi:hypothetical protein